MISFIKKNRRLFIIPFFALVLFITGAGAMENNMELVSGCLLFSAMCLFFYLPVTWILKRLGYMTINESWKRKEIWGILILIGASSLIGAINAFFVKPEFTLLFLLVVIFTGVLARLYLQKVQIIRQGFSNINKDGLLQFAFWVFTFGFGLLLIIFDDFDQQDALAVLSVFYFPTLFFLVVRWIFRQIRFLINLKNEQTKTELLHLKSQVNPHFFFNTLNNLYGLIAKDSKQARTLVLKLSDMMRYSIYEGEKEEVPIEEEVEYLKNYIELHRMRYHKTIDVKFEVNIQQEDLKIMPLLFIILLENAFKHGVENLIKAPYVYVNLRANEKEVSFEVENNFDKKARISQGGIGLKNLKRRLELVYPRKHQLTFSTGGDFYKAHLSIKL